MFIFLLLIVAKCEKLLIEVIIEKEQNIYSIINFLMPFVCILDR